MENTSLQVNQVVDGRWIISTLISKTSFTEVYKVFDKEQRREAALKLELPCVPKLALNRWKVTTQIYFF